MCRSLHKTSIIPDAIRTGSDWPVMWRTRKCEVVLHIDANAVIRPVGYIPFLMLLISKALLILARHNFLGHSSVEQTRLQQQARELADESARLFDQIGLVVLHHERWKFIVSPGNCERMTGKPVVISGHKYHWRK